MVRQVESKTVKVFDTHKAGDGETRIHIIELNGKRFLAKQHFWLPEGEDDMQPGKVRMMNADDVAVIVKNMKEIKSLMSA